MHKQADDLYLHFILRGGQLGFLILIAVFTSVDVFEVTDKESVHKCLVAFKAKKSKQFKQKLFLIVVVTTTCHHHHHFNCTFYLFSSPVSLFTYTLIERTECLKFEYFIQLLFSSITSEDGIEDKFIKSIKVTVRNIGN